MRSEMSEYGNRAHHNALRACRERMEEICQCVSKHAVTEGYYAPNLLRRASVMIVVRVREAIGASARECSVFRTFSKTFKPDWTGHARARRRPVAAGISSICIWHFRIGMIGHFKLHRLAPCPRLARSAQTGTTAYHHVFICSS